MSETTDQADVDGGTGFLRRFPRLGVLAWSFIGAVIALGIIMSALGAVSEIILPLTFAAVLAIIFRPMAVSLGQKVGASAGAGLIVLGLLLMMAVVIVATVKGITEQMDEIGESASSAIETIAEQTEDIEVDEAALEDARAAINEASPTVESGVLANIVEGIDGLIAIAGGLILGALIMYYLLKDGSSLRRSVVGQFDASYRDEVNGFVGDACRILRDYGKGRTIMSAIVATAVGLAALIMGLPLVLSIAVVNFVGGYIPYVGAFLGGGLAVIVAIGEGGLAQGAIMLVVVLVANLALENFVEPKVMGRTLDIHPLVVLVVTALGGLLGGIVGLILAVPAWVIAGNAFSRLRSGGLIDAAVEKAQPAVKQLLD